LCHLPAVESMAAAATEKFH